MIRGMSCRTAFYSILSLAMRLTRKWEDVDHDAEDGIPQSVSSPTSGGAFEAEVRDPLGLGAPIE